MCFFTEERMTMTMRFQRLIFLFLILILSRASVVHSADYRPHYVSLGRDCQPASAFIGFQLREASFPLDWVASPNFEGVIEAFRDDFKYFLDPNYLQYFPHGILNTYYNFGFNHFFPAKDGVVPENFLDYLPEVRATQNRRIQRVKDLLTSNEVIVFIRTHIEPIQAAHFVALLRTKYPQLRFLLAVVHERADLIGNWHLDRVVNFYASQRSGAGDWWSPGEWGAIFGQINQIITTYKW